MLAPLRGLGPSLADRLQPLTYRAAQRGTDTTDPRVTVTYLKGGFVPSVPSGLVDAVVDHFRADMMRHLRSAYEADPRMATAAVTHHIAQGVVYEQDGVTVTAFNVDHSSESTAALEVRLQ